MFGSEQPQTHRGCLTPVTGQATRAMVGAGQQMAPRAWAVWDPLPRPLQPWAHTPNPSDPSSLSSHLCFVLAAALPHPLQGCVGCKPRGKAAAVSPPARSITCCSCPSLPLPGHWHPFAHASARPSPLLAQPRRFGSRGDTGQGRVTLDGSRRLHPTPGELNPRT